MQVVSVIDEDFSNYKCPSMVIGFPTCSFKCGRRACQNRALANAPKVEIEAADLVERYLQNPITEAIVFGGLEPFDSPEMFDLVEAFRKRTDDTIVIYTGYTREEAEEKAWIDWLKYFPNIVVKYGRYVPGQTLHFDGVLGVNLASDNQYAVMESVKRGGSSHEGHFYNGEGNKEHDSVCGKTGK